MILREVADGGSIEITHHGHPIAQLIPAPINYDHESAGSAAGYNVTTVHPGGAPCYAP